MNPFIIEFMPFADCGQILIGKDFGAYLSLIVKMLQFKPYPLTTTHWTRNMICESFSTYMILSRIGELFVKPHMCGYFTNMYVYTHNLIYK